MIFSRLTQQTRRYTFRSVEYVRLRKLFLSNARLVAVNVLPCLRRVAAERKLVGRDTDYGAVFLMKGKDGVRELAGDLEVEVGKEGGAMQQRAGEGGEGVDVEVVDG